MFRVFMLCYELSVGQHAGRCAPISSHWLCSMVCLQHEALTRALWHACTGPVSRALAGYPLGTRQCCQCGACWWRRAFLLDRSPFGTGPAKLLGMCARARSAGHACGWRSQRVLAGRMHLVTTAKGFGQGANMRLAQSKRLARAKAPLLRAAFAAGTANLLLSCWLIFFCGSLLAHMLSSSLLKVSSISAAGKLCLLLLHYLCAMRAMRRH